MKDKTSNYIVRKCINANQSLPTLILSTPAPPNYLSFSLLTPSPLLPSSYSSSYLPPPPPSYSTFFSASSSLLLAFPIISPVPAPLSFFSFYIYILIFSFKIISQ